MKRILPITIILVLCLIAANNPVFAGNGQSGAFTRSWPESSEGYVTYKQGEIIRFTGSIYAGMRGDTYACGLTDVTVTPAKMITAQNYINTSNIKYPATLQANEWTVTMTLDTADIPLGVYRFYFVHTWTGQGSTHTYDYQDIQIVPGETPASWAVESINTARSKSLIPSDFNSLYTSNITRLDFCKLITNFLTQKTRADYSFLVYQKGGDFFSSPFEDNAGRDVIACAYLGIVSGKGNGNFDPFGYLTREEAAQIITNCARLLGHSPDGSQPAYADNAQISDWAKEAVAFVSQRQIMSGTGGNKFSPKDPYTYQQTYITLLNLFDSLTEWKLDLHPPIPAGEGISKDLPIDIYIHTLQIETTGFDTNTGSTPDPGYKQFSIEMSYPSGSTLSQDVRDALLYQGFLLGDGQDIYSFNNLSNTTSMMGSSGGTVTLSAPVPENIDTSKLQFVLGDKKINLNASGGALLPAGRTETMQTPMEIDDGNVRIVSAQVDDWIGLTTESGYQIIEVELEFDINAYNLSNYLSGSYLVTADGTRYRFSGSRQIPDSAFRVGYAVPQGMTASDFTFVFRDNLRKLQ